MRPLLLVFTLARGPAAGGDGWFSADKVQHFFSAAFVQSMTYGTLRAAGVGHGVALAGASVTTAAVGVGKEIYDAKYGGDPSVKDLVWDGLGGVAATGLLVRVER